MYRVCEGTEMAQEMAQTGNTKMSSRNRSRAWCFTWNNPPIGSVAQITEYFEKMNMLYVFQMERGESNGVEHLQGVCRFENPRDNWPQIDMAIHWERCKSWPKSKKYCCKLDTRIDGPWTNVDGLTYRASLRDPLEGYELYDFQKKIIDMMNVIPNDRIVHWYWEPDGKCGKTSLARHLRIKYGRRVLYVNGVNRDIFCRFAKLNEDGIDVDMVIFGLTRQDANRMSYRSLEMMKDGIAFSGKYESTDIVFNPPHVVVFANFAPDRELISEDRWNVVRI